MISTPKLRVVTTLALAILGSACGPTSPTGSGGQGGTGGSTGGTGGSTGGTGGSTGGTGGTPTGPQPTNLPTARQACPQFVNGDMTFIGRRVKIWVDPNAAQKGPGPVIFYWHGTGSNPTFEVPAGLGPAVQNVVNAGGIIAGLYSEPSLACPGCTGIEASGTGNSVWFKKDFETADEVLACAIQRLNIDKRHIHSAGMSAGGLQVSSMYFERSNYLASVVSYSGGRLFPTTTADPNNHLPIVLTHGGTNDKVIIPFQTASENLANEVKPLGNFVVMCNHGRGHTIPVEFGSGGAAWRFFNSHPYGVRPDPYAGGLPSDVPSFCRIW